MKASEITNIIEHYNELPYQCIFIDGPWGIGKSYAVDHIDSSKVAVTRVSLAGLKTADEIYSDILDSLTNHNNLEGIVKKAGILATGFMKANKKTKVAGEILEKISGNLVTPKGVVKAYLVHENADTCIAFDDIERMAEGADAAVLFHVVESLQTCQTKVILIGDSGNFNPDFNEKFLLYQERYIDKVYKIDSPADSLDWETLKIDDSEFVDAFRQKHHFKNLRTIIKANQFYRDVKMTLTNDSIEELKNSTEKTDPLFWYEIRLCCYAIVVESIENLYQKNVKEDAGKLEMDLVFAANNFLERVENNYLKDTLLTSQFVSTLIVYYKNNTIDPCFFEPIVNEARLYEELSNKKKSERISNISSDSQITFFSDKEHLQKYINNLCELMQKDTDISYLLGHIRSYYNCNTTILDNDSDPGMEIFVNSAERILNKEVKNYQTDLFTNARKYSFRFDRIPKLKTKFETLLEKYASEQLKFWVNNVIEVNAEAYISVSCLLDFNKESNKEKLKPIIEDNWDSLFKAALPINARNNDQYHTCYLVLKLLNNIDDDKLQNSCEHFDFNNIDPVARFRCYQIMKKLEGDNKAIN